MENEESETWDLLGNVHVAEGTFGIQVGQTVLVTHHPRACRGEFCCIHNPSNHALSTCPMNWRADRGLMERICPHGIGHPDPDDLAHKQRVMSAEDYEDRAFDVHGCDGCCTGPFIPYGLDVD